MQMQDLVKIKFGAAKYQTTKIQDNYWKKGTPLMVVGKEMN